MSAFDPLATAEECGATPVGSVFRCRKPTGHAGQHGDGCGNRWHQRGTYLCDLYHPEIDFASRDSWEHHNKTVHTGQTFTSMDHDGAVSRACWSFGERGSRPCVAPPPPRLSPTEELEKQKLMRQFGRDEARLGLTGAEVCGYEYATGARCAQGKRDCAGHPQPAPFVMKRLGDLPPEAQAEVRRLLAEAQRETPKINPICITKTDEPAPRDPPAFCAACHLRAPEEIGYLANVNAKGLRPKRDGWMLAAFPFIENRAVIPEHTLLCPPCGEKVAKFIAHLSTPMLGDEDLL